MHAMAFRKTVLLILIVLPFLANAQDTLRGDSLQRKPLFVEDDPVVAMLDSLTRLKIFEGNTVPGSQNPGSYSDGSIPYFPDSVYRDRISDMSVQSPFEYVYNSDVKMFIDLYAYKKRGLTARILGLSQIYFPLFEEKLDKYNMPLELKYLAVIESALNPVANSRAGAKGLWQFMYGTGKVYGLKISSYYDDRFDPYKSTIAACEHLTDLYAIYGNWSLALAAYNSGAGNVNKAIRRAGGAKNFWVIQKYLPKETRSYVPAFIAASYVMTYAGEHKISPVDPGILFYEIDTVTVKNPLTFDQISEMLKVPMDELQFLNPAFKQGMIPATPETPFSLRLRKKYIADFINNEKTLYAFKTKKGLERDSLMAIALMNNRETIEYVVKKGESINSVAKKFHMSVSELKSLNNLKKSYVKPKQRLLVYSGKGKPVVPVAPPSSGSTVAENPPQKSPPPGQEDSVEEEIKPVTHVVKSGESLGKIATKYGCTTQQIIDWNNLKSQNILVGQKLKINPGVRQETASAVTKPASKTGTTTKKTGGTKYIYHTIQPGETLWDIAERYDGATVAQIKKLNNITNAQRIRAGQKIKIMPVN